MTKIAFLGQGRMGVPMAGRLIAAGHETSVWNRTREKAHWAADKGGVVADTPAAAVRDADVVITMLRDAEAVDAVLFGHEGAADELPSDAVVLEMSTIGPGAVESVRARLRDDVRLVDAPVVGSVPQATAGELRILVGGVQADVERCAGVLAALGTVDHVGPLSAGAAAKLVANLVTVTTFAMIGEAFTLGDRLGLTTERTLQLLEGSAVGPFVKRIRPRIGDEEFPTQFSIGLAEKDVRLALAAGLDPSGVTGAARNSLAAIVESGLAERDISVVISDMRSRVSDTTTDE